MVSAASLQWVTTILMGVIGFGVAGIAWYLRRYVVEEVEKNSEMRKFLLGGDSIDLDEGHVDDIEARIDTLQNELRLQHEDVNRRLEALGTGMDRIIELLEEEHDTEIESPDWND